MGVDSSPTLACAARTASPEIEVIEADVARLDFDDGVAHLAVACMSLLNIDELDTVLSEIARVLAPAGHFCFATLHPSTSFDYVLDRDPDASYLEERAYVATAERGGLRMTSTICIARSRFMSGHSSAQDC